MRLYHLPPSRSTRVLWMLEELGEPYDLTLMTREDRKTDEHRRRHPLGRVPVLEDDEGPLFESAAICLHLADCYPEAGLNWPLGTHERGLVYQWTLYAMTELEPAILEARIYREKDPARAQAGVERFGPAAAVIEEALTSQKWLVGDRFSVADLTLGAVLIYANGAGLIEGLPNVQAYVERLEARPARQRATAIGT
jgi:glutathione S-transferase